MLKGISPLLSPELLKALDEMGHGDTLVIADGNFPAESVGKNAKVIRADGHGVPELLAQFDSGERHGLLSALGADPRPRYQEDSERVYGMRYAGKNVRFTVGDGVVHVVEVET